jgi:trk system potassium uptake protein
VLVVGLGRFGTALATELERLGHEVLAVDADETVVNAIAPEVTHALQLDAREEHALRAAGAAEFAYAVVALSGDAEASIFATTALKQLGIRHIIAKAGSELHGVILERVGADRVVFPEREMGVQVAQTIGMPDLVEYLEIAPGYGVERIRLPQGLVGRALGELEPVARGRVTAIAVCRETRVIANPPATERLVEGDELVVMGRGEDVARLRG